MRIQAIADLHGDLPEIPECDILLIAGDICPDFIGATGPPLIARQFQWLERDFRLWLESVPAKYVVGIAGNHDFVFQNWPHAVSKIILLWSYLQDSAISIEGIKIYGTPWVPNLEYWAFYLNDINLMRRAESIPEDIDILLTHGPPYGYCDFTASAFGETHAGDPYLADAIDKILPKAVICGHIHEGRGTDLMLSDVPVYNVAHMDEFYKQKRGPIEIIFNG